MNSVDIYVCLSKVSEMAVSELPGNPNAVWTVKRHVEGEDLLISGSSFFYRTSQYYCCNISSDISLQSIRSVLVAIVSSCGLLVSKDCSVVSVHL